MAQAKAGGDFEELVEVDGGEWEVAEDECGAGGFGLCEGGLEPVELWVVVADGARDVECDDEDVARGDGVIEWECAAW